MLIRIATPSGDPQNTSVGGQQKHCMGLWPHTAYKSIHVKGPEQSSEAHE